MRAFALAIAIIESLAVMCLADAKGLVRVQQSNGSVQLYPESTVVAGGKTLKITTANKKGTIIITDAACSFVDQLMRCLPYALVLKQNGTFPIAIRSGTIYFNTTNQPLTLKYSSTQVPPNGVLGILQTVHGTYVTITGSLDGGPQR